MSLVSYKSMRKWICVLAACLFPVFLSRAQEIPGNPSLLEISEYLAANPDGPLADAYSDLLALRRAQTLGPESTEEDYQDILSVARTDETKAKIQSVWADIISQKEQSRRSVRAMGGSHVSMRYGAIFTNVSAGMMGFQYRWGHETLKWHYLAGFDMVFGPFGNKTKESSMGFTPYAGVSYRMPSIKSHLTAAIYVDNLILVTKDTFRKITPEIALSYGFTPIKYFTAEVFVRATPFPYFKQKEFYESTTVDYSVLKPLLDERIRAGIFLYMNLYQ